MKRAGIFLHTERAEAAQTAAWLAAELVKHGADVFALDADAARANSNDIVATTELPADLDIVFVLGGDGTLLRAADTVGLDGPPLLGVNFGHLGFLSELERGELANGLARVFDQGFTVEERTSLEAEIVSPDGATMSLRALNDVVVAKIAVGRAIRLAVEVGREPFGSWSADGLIVATSTGSTAYSFSAGGPVVSPRIGCLVVTPVAPHGLFDRSFIVAADEELTVRVLPDPDAASLSADGGRAIPLPAGTVVRVRTSAGKVRLAKLAPAPFWRLVREKVFLQKEMD